MKRSRSNLKIEPPKHSPATVRVYRGFELFHDGAHDMSPINPQGAGTYTMGVTKLYYKEEENELHVHVRRPGLLIGERGKNINALQEFLECTVHIHEVRNLWD